MKINDRDGNRDLGRTLVSSGTVSLCAPINALIEAIREGFALGHDKPDAWPRATSWPDTILEELGALQWLFADQRALLNGVEVTSDLREAWADRDAAIARADLAEARARDAERDARNAHRIAGELETRLNTLQAKYGALVDALGVVRDAID